MMVNLVQTRPNDRDSLDRLIQPTPELASFVHYGWFWSDRAQADPEIHMNWIVKDQEKAGVIAYGPYEAIDLDPTSRQPGAYEICHLVVHHQFIRQGIGKHAVKLATKVLGQTMELRRLYASIHPENLVSQTFFKNLGFVKTGERADAETSEIDYVFSLSDGALHALIDA